MIPTLLRDGEPMGRAGLVLCLTLLTAAIGWWRDRRLLRAADDPALPELLASRRRDTIRAIAIATALIIVLGGRDAAWGIPLLIMLVIAAAYPVRTRLMGETWGFGWFLWHSAMSFAGGFGFWIALAYTPIAVDAMVRTAGTDRWWIALSIVPVLLAWEHWYPEIWLRTHAARPLADDRLDARFAGIVQRAGTVVPGVYRVGPQGSRFVNAVALPSVRRPAVAMGDALLELLDPDEAAAIFAHEVAHFDHFTSREIRRRQAINRVLIVVAVALPIVAIFHAPSARGWIGWLWPLVMLLALARRAATSQQHETASDLRAATLCGDPDALVRGLVKLHAHARIPRRWALDIEQAATHPSLVRRIQAIRGGDAALEQLGESALVCSARGGSWVAIENLRAYWFEGVPPGTPADVDALRRAATSYRAVSYEDLVELRVVASGGTRALRARTRAGDALSVPLAPEDVARVQGALDVVDVRLGRAARTTNPLAPRLVAAVAVLAMIISGQVGVTLAGAALVAWKPGPVSLVALGAMCIARALFGAFEGSYFLSGAPFHAALVALAGIGVVALSMAVRRTRAGEVDAWFRTVAGVLAAVTAIAAAGFAAEAATAAGVSFGMVRAGTLATALLGLAAALTVMPERRTRWVGRGGLVAAGLVGVLAVDRAALALRGALTESSARATLVSDIDLGGMVQGLRVSPGGVRFAATRIPAGRRFARGASPIMVVGRVGGPTRDIAGVAAEFVDDERLLVLDVLDRGLELRVERADSASPPLWADTLPGVGADRQRLEVDRGGEGWTVVDYDANGDGAVLLTGRIGRRGIERRVALPDTLAMMGEPIVFGAVGTVIVPVSAGARRAPGMWWLVPLTGADYLRSELWRLRGDSARRVASLRGLPQCGVPAGGVAACVVRRMNGVSLYSVAADGAATEVSRPPGRSVGVVDVGPGPRAVAVTFDRMVLVADLAARSLTRIAMPPDVDYAAEVRAGAGYLVALRYGENGRSRIRAYRVE